MEKTFPSNGAPASNRRNIWELSTHHHCSIVGTCLTIGEARAIGKRLAYDAPIRMIWTQPFTPYWFGRAQQKTQYPFYSISL